MSPSRKSRENDHVMIWHTEEESAPKEKVFLLLFCSTLIITILQIGGSGKTVLVSKYIMTSIAPPLRGRGGASARSSSAV